MSKWGRHSEIEPIEVEKLGLFRAMNPICLELCTRIVPGIVESEPGCLTLDLSDAQQRGLHNVLKQTRTIHDTQSLSRKVLRVVIRIQKLEAHAALARECYHPDKWDVDTSLLFDGSGKAYPINDYYCALHDRRNGWYAGRIATLVAIKVFDLMFIRRNFEFKEKIDAWT